MPPATCLAASYLHDSRRGQGKPWDRAKTTAGSGLRTRGQTRLAWISGKMRRKSMPVLSVPGALVGGDEVGMAVFHELSRAEGPSQQSRKTTAHIGESPEAYGVFHEVSRAEGPSQQGRKTTAHIGESPEAYGVFHEVSRAAGPSQQGRKTTAHIGESPEAYGVFHEVSRAAGPSQQGRKTTAHIG